MVAAVEGFNIPIAGAIKTLQALGHEVVPLPQRMAHQLGVDVTEAAWGIERIVNSNMANATRKVLASHGADARDLSLIAYGGNGAVHAVASGAGGLGLRFASSIC